MFHAHVRARLACIVRAKGPHRRTVAAFEFCEQFAIELIVRGGSEMIAVEFDFVTKDRTGQPPDSDDGVTST